MDGTIRFQAAAPDDALLWAQTRQKAWDATYRGIYPDDWIDFYDVEAHAARDRAKLADANVFSYLVMDGAACAGYFSYGPTGTGEFCLHSVYLLPGYQKQGTGTRIFQQLAEHCLALGYSAFYNHCNEHNVSARRFYEKMGGRLTRIDGSHENKAEDQCRYEYDLTKGEQPWQPKPL